MKNKFIFISLTLFICLSCKKNTPPKTVAPTVTSFSVDGININNPSHSSFISGTNFDIIAYSQTSNPEIQILFSGSAAPSLGSYQITTGTIYNGQCQFVLSDTSGGVQGNSSAIGGTVNVGSISNAPYHKVSFYNISVSGAGGSHSVSGTITF